MVKTALVVTTISSPNPVLKSLAQGCQASDWDFIIVGDTKSPTDFSLPGTQYYDVPSQMATGLKFAQICPTKHYARKNIGYLLAIKSGVESIVETDDDNFPSDGFWLRSTLEVNSKILESSNWVNVYRYFTNSQIWPRGLPLDTINDPCPDVKDLATSNVICPIQQGLANQNPDVDAIYRLILPLPIDFQENIQVALGKGAWCPFNSQNTVWFPPAYPLLYLPAYCSFRMTDIWRSFVAQRICWENGWHILFKSPTVYQERNEHNLMKDFADEVSGYLNNRKIAELLGSLSLQSGENNIPDNLRKCYEILVKSDLVGEKESDLLEAWLEDIK